MRIDDAEALKNWLSRLKNGNDYRAESSLKTLAAKLRNAGKTESAKGVERLL